VQFDEPLINLGVVPVVGDLGVGELAPEVADADPGADADRELRVDVDGDAVLDVGAEPISMGSASARSVAPYQTLALAASVT
jgi:hypothetical protein